jgi:hypothetical protein
MKKHHIILSVFGIFAIASILPGDALAEDTPRRPLQELRMEWQEDRAEHRDARRDDRQEAVGVFKENRKEAMDDWKEAGRERRADWSEHKAEARAQFAEDRADFKGRLASSTDAFRARFVGEKKEKIAGHLEAMFTRFDGVIAKLTALTDRIETRIETLEADGVDVTEATASLEDAKTSIATAETVIEETNETIKAAIDNEEEISREGLRDLVQEAKAAIKTAHGALVDVVQLLKASSN